MARAHPNLNQAQLEVLAEWEAMLRQPSEATCLVFQPAMQRQFDEFVALPERKFEDLLVLQKNRVREMFNVHAAKHDLDMKFVQNFMARVHPNLSQAQLEVLEESIQNGRDDCAAVKQLSAPRKRKWNGFVKFCRHAVWNCALWARGR